MLQTGSTWVGLFVVQVCMSLCIKHDGITESNAAHVLRVDYRGAARGLYTAC